MCPGTPSEDVQNQRRAVDYLDLKSFFKIPLLIRRKLVVKNKDAVISAVLQGNELLQLAPAYIICT